MNSFAAIDFETANEHRTSVCSVGVVLVRDREITDTFYSLIRPEPEFYRYWNTRVHGITLADTVNAPIFPHVWQQIEPLIQGLPLIAHNKGFDESCLRACFRTYQMDYPELTLSQLSFSIPYTSNATFLAISIFKNQSSC